MENPMVYLPDAVAEALCAVALLGVAVEGLAGAGLAGEELLHAARVTANGTIARPVSVRWSLLLPAVMVRTSPSLPRPPHAPLGMLGFDRYEDRITD